MYGFRFGSPTNKQNDILHIFFPLAKIEMI